MLGLAKKTPGRLQAVERIEEWTRERFSLPKEAAVSVAEVACSLPGWAPLETVVMFWIGEQRSQFKLFKPVAEVIVDDHLRHRLEQLELGALFPDPEHDHGLQRRPSGEAAGDLRNRDRRLFREAEALSRPLLDALDRLETSWSLLGQTQHRISLA